MKYAEELEISQCSWKTCTVCGFAIRTSPGGRAKMLKHFQTEHGDLK